MTAAFSGLIVYREPFTNRPLDLGADYAETARTQCASAATVKIEAASRPGRDAGFLAGVPARGLQVEVISN